ncbi:MAG: TolC family protein [Deltaproteobacteria bacterium]|nr:TolC family protein [Deltaproteobacteria bacterium]
MRTISQWPARWALTAALFAALLVPAAPVFAAETLALEPLIAEALANNRELRAAESRIAAADFRITQAWGFPDPVVSIGYQNEGLTRYNYGESPDAQWMYSVTQAFPFFGKRELKQGMAKADAEGARAAHEALQLRVVSRVKELYYDLALIHRNLDLVGERTALFARIEEAALSRYASGTAPQADAVMAQTEKYMLREREAMLRQKIQSLEAMLSLTLGRETPAAFSRPEPVPFAPYLPDERELDRRAYAFSPEIKNRERMIAAAEAKVDMLKREYYPDFMLKGSLAQRPGEYRNMWGIETAVNIPIFYKTKQEPAVREAQAGLEGAKHEMEALKLMTASGIRDNLAMLRAAENLMELYRNALIPKAAQDFSLALAGYGTGKNDVLTVITRLKSYLDYELLYQGQLTERAKAVARIEALTEPALPGK